MRYWGDVQPWSYCNFIRDDVKLEAEFQFKSGREGQEGYIKKHFTMITVTNEMYLNRKYTEILGRG